MAVPVLFINCNVSDFIGDIIFLRKLYETRTRKTLHCLLGQTVYIAQTGKGKPVVRCSAVVSDCVEIRTRSEWNRYKHLLCIPDGSKYDWQPDTKAKYLYKLDSVKELEPFPAPEGKRHGRIWMEVEL